MEVQHIIVFVISIGCILYAIYRIVQYFKDINNNKNPCDGCTSDCALRDVKKKKSSKQGKCCH